MTFVLLLPGILAIATGLGVFLYMRHEAASQAADAGDDPAPGEPQQGYDAAFAKTLAGQRELVEQVRSLEQKVDIQRRVILRRNARAGQLVRRGESLARRTTHPA
jgi:hypothetical protein